MRPFILYKLGCTTALQLPLHLLRLSPSDVLLFGPPHRESRISEWRRPSVPILTYKSRTEVRRNFEIGENILSHVRNRQPYFMDSKRKGQGHTGRLDFRTVDALLLTRSHQQSFDNGF